MIDRGVVGVIWTFYSPDPARPTSPRPFLGFGDVITPSGAWYGLVISTATKAQQPELASIVTEVALLAPPVRDVSQAHPYFDFQVEPPARQVEGTGTPPYPEIFRPSCLEGEVLAQFVVNEDGNIDVRTFKVLRATNDMFALAVRSALTSMRFRPAMTGGKTVKQLVQRTFHFTP